MKIFTIGFTQTTAENFFGRIKASGATKIADVRLNNVSQLAGFAKRDDLRYFAREICGVDYEHIPSLAPTKVMLDDLKKRKGEWRKYEQDFVNLMSQRRIEDIPKESLDGACLLCSEDKPHQCHRRLVVEYLRDRWGGLDIVHL